LMFNLLLARRTTHSADAPLVGQAVGFGRASRRRIATGYFGVAHQTVQTGALLAMTDHRALGVGTASRGGSAR
jgi:hypothetical protein